MTWNVGDLVRERPRTGVTVATSDPQTAMRLSQRMKYPRVGRVVAVEQRSNARGAKCTYLDIIWDGLQTPSRHGVARLERIPSAAGQQP